MTEPSQPPVPQDPYADPPQNTPVYGIPAYQPGQASVPPPYTPPQYNEPQYSAPPYNAPVSSPYGAPVDPTIQQPAKRKTGLIVGIIAGVLALCLVGVCLAGIGYYYLSPDSDDDPEALLTSYPYPTSASSYTPPEITPTTEAPPPEAPARVGDCISVNESGDFLGVGNCSKGGATYKVLTVDYSKADCEDPDSGYITEDGYRLCLERYLLETYCYKFPKNNGWVVPATKCKAKGTVHIIDIVQGASNGDKCTKAYKWNKWYRFTHPVTVYCVMEY